MQVILCVLPDSEAGGIWEIRLDEGTPVPLVGDAIRLDADFSGESDLEDIVSTLERERSFQVERREFAYHFADDDEGDYAHVTLWVKEAP